MLDPFGRRITYLRVSVTDRCDLRCFYCMAEDMEFRPRDEVLTLEELDRLAAAFIRQGVRKIRLTGGEPLVRRNVISLIRSLGQRLGHGLDELALTTNATRLAEHAPALAQAGIRRVNVSLDSLDPQRFRAITRKGDLAQVLAGIEAARQAGLAIKINMVAMRGENDDEIDGMVAWCGARGFDLVLIETMPMGDAKADRYLPLAEVRANLAGRWTLLESDHATGGPARYLTVAETGRRIGFITPLSHNFCESCNRVRLTCTGRLYLCLGREDGIDFRAPLRAGAGDADLDGLIRQAITAKPKAHDFVPGGTGTRMGAVRPMSLTGG
ncbi:MAG: GTP 3',8-cyclase MoaA [Rhodospirillales bacterium]|nr:GTP 3',8-cyclase MoaA [Rhodospirillales bacterium]